MGEEFRLQTKWRGHLIQGVQGLLQTWEVYIDPWTLQAPMIQWRYSQPGHPPVLLRRSRERVNPSVRFCRLVR